MGERSTTGLELVRSTSEIVDLNKEASSHGLESVEEFETGDHIFFKVIPKRGVVRFDKQGELSSMYIGPSRYSREWVQSRTGWFCYQGYQVFKKYSMFPCSEGTPHIRLECWIGASLSLMQKGTIEKGPVHV